MRRTLLVLSALALAGGCDPGEFGSALDRAPVQFFGDPGGFGTDVGRMLLPLAPPADPNVPNVAARLLFAGTHALSLAVADFDGNGKPHVQTTTGQNLLDKLGLTSGQDSVQNGISSAAWLSGASGAGSSALEKIVLGIPNSAPAGSVAFLNLATDASGNVDFKSAGELPRHGLPTEQHFGLAVARGRVTQAAADEAVVVSDSGVHVLGFLTGDVLSAASCAVSLPMPPDLYRSLAVGDFLLEASASSKQDEIAVGLPTQDPAGHGRVVILHYVAGAAELGCPMEVSVPGGNPPGFGATLAVVPHGEGKAADLLVGAPPDRAYLLFSPFDGSTKPLMFTNGDAASQFGQRVALAGAVDSEGVQKIAITAWQADVGGTKKAGQVFIYELVYSNGVAVDSQLVAVVNDSNPIADKEYFGIGLADLEFDNRSPICPKGRDTHLLVVGADAGIFTFFSFAGTADPTKALAPDPRCFAQK